MPRSNEEYVGDLVAKGRWANEAEGWKRRWLEEKTRGDKATGLLMGRVQKLEAKLAKALDRVRELEAEVKNKGRKGGGGGID